MQAKPCAEALCFDEPNALALVVNLQKMQTWIDAASARCKE